MFRKEYPRPELVRQKWQNLNGTWDFRFGEESWRDIEVPFAFQAPLSGIGENRMCDEVSYRREFTVDPSWKGQVVMLHFGAVDYRCVVSVNGQRVGEHTGGNAAFSFPVTECLNWESETLEVRVWDPCEDETIPRGKQYWLEKPDSIWYTRTTGIWQTVWLEALPKVHFEQVRFTPDIDRGEVKVNFVLSERAAGASATIRVAFREEEVVSLTVNAEEAENTITLDLFRNHIFRTPNHHDGWCWTPEHPNLFTAELELNAGDSADRIQSYFGMRKIEQKDGKVYLNNRPYYQKLILDQGYFQGGLLTAREESDFIRDITMSKEMGFNGCRKHQKAEDPLFLYHADRLGYLVWSEIGSCVSYTSRSAQRTLAEWKELIERDYNHPCIVAWVVLNESWGVPNIRFDKKQQAHSLALYYNTLSMDDTRLVIANDGWEMTKTDICAIHNYLHGARGEHDKHQAFARMLSTKEELLTSMPAGRSIYADGYSHQGEPILLTEFGGLSYAQDKEKGWGYTTIETEEEFLETYRRIIGNIASSQALFGYCYTQLCDVEQEVNGLLTEDRRFKVAPEEIKRINNTIG